MRELTSREELQLTLLLNIPFSRRTEEHVKKIHELMDYDGSIESSIDSLKDLFKN